jgi:hypothetical protein
MYFQCLEGGIWTPTMGASGHQSQNETAFSEIVSVLRLRVFRVLIPYGFLPMDSIFHCFIIQGSRYSLRFGDQRHELVIEAFLDRCGRCPHAAGGAGERAGARSAPWLMWLGSFVRSSQRSAFPGVVFSATLSGTALKLRFPPKLSWYSFPAGSLPGRSPGLTAASGMMRPLWFR